VRCSGRSGITGRLVQEEKNNGRLDKASLLTDRTVVSVLRQLLGEDYLSPQVAAVRAQTTVPFISKNSRRIFHILGN